MVAIAPVIPFRDRLGLLFPLLGTFHVFAHYPQRVVGGVVLVLGLVALAVAGAVLIVTLVRSDQ